MNLFFNHSRSADPSTYYFIKVSKEDFIKSMTEWRRIAAYLIVIVIDDNAVELLTTDEVDEFIKNSHSILVK